MTSAVAVDRPLRIAFLSVSAEMGGSEVSLLALVRGLRRLAPASQLDVVVPREGALSEAVRAAGARAHALPLPPRLGRLGERSDTGAAGAISRGASLLLAAGSVAPYSRRLAKLLAAIGPEIVHSNGFKLHVLGARVAPAASAMVWHLHEYISHRPISRRLLRRYADRCQAIVANSRSVAAEVAAELSPAGPVCTVYNAVDTCVFSPEGDVIDLDALAGLPPPETGIVRVGLVATYGRWKGHTTFIEALRNLRASSPWRAYIIGGAVYDTSGSQYSCEELASAIDQAGLSKRVGLTGFVNRPAAALRALDVIVHASTQPEPFGLVIAEGLASARAVIVSAAGGAAELVRDEVDALTHPPGDAAALAQRIGRLVDDPALRSRLGMEGRRTAMRMFDPDAFTTAFMKIYQEARTRVPHHVGR